MASLRPCFALVFLALAASATTMGGTGGGGSLIITNTCPYTVWPSVFNGGGGGAAAALDIPAVSFQLAPGQSVAVPVPSIWSGRVCGRADCGDPRSGNGCPNFVAGNPLTVAELTINKTDTYAISLVHGYNLPMLVQATNGATSCTPTSCALDVDKTCPEQLRVPSGSVAGTGGCRSPCGAFGEPQFCCVGAYASPDTCGASAYSEAFKAACPQAITYPFDLAGTFFACGDEESSSSRVITVAFCPATMSSASGAGAATRIPYDKNSAVGTEDDNNKLAHIAYVVAIIGLVGAVLAALTALLTFLKKCCF